LRDENTFLKTKNEFLTKRLENIQKEMKEKHPDTDAVKIAELGRKHFDANKNHFKQMLNK
jgi:hypothetical protein